MNNKLSGILLLFSFFAASGYATEIAADRWLVVHVGSLLAVPGSPVLRNHSIIVHSDRIESLRAGHIEPRSVHREARLLDLSGYFVLPGLIDVQNHFTAEVGQAPRVDRRLSLSDADVALNGAWFASRTLQAGFTTVRDMGDPGTAMFALRDAIDAGTITGPRMQAAGQIIGPDLGSISRRPEFEEILSGNAGCSGADNCGQAVRNQIRRGADTIKIYVNHDLLPDTRSYFTAAELTAMVDAAHNLGRKITASAFSAEAINSALRAGVDGIVHGVFLNDESIRLFLFSGAYLIPTLNAAETVRELALDATARVSNDWRHENLEIHRAMTEGFGSAHKAGVPIAFGTDSGWRRHGENARQFLLMVAGGMSEIEAIVAATVNAAEAMGLSNSIGSIAPGKYADFIAVPASPIVDITQLQNVFCVVKAGIVYNCPAADTATSSSRNVDR